MNSFRVLYNLEILSSRIMPSNQSSNSNKFGEDFVKSGKYCLLIGQFLITLLVPYWSGGLRLLLNVLEKDALPLDIDYDIRQSAYLIALQLAAYILCGQLVVSSSSSEVR